MFMCIFICIFMVSFMCMSVKKINTAKTFISTVFILLYFFVSVSPMLKLPLQHPADNPFWVVILYTQTLLVGVIVLLPLFAVIAAVTLALPDCLYRKLFGTDILILPALRSSHLTRNCDDPAWFAISTWGTLTLTGLYDQCAVRVLDRKSVV